MNAPRRERSVAGGLPRERRHDRRLGQRITALRPAREWTQAEVARRTDGSAEEVSAVGAASDSSVHAEGGETA